MGAVPQVNMYLPHHSCMCLFFEAERSGRLSLDLPTTALSITIPPRPPYTGPSPEDAERLSLARTAQEIVPGLYLGGASVVGPTVRGCLVSRVLSLVTRPEDLGDVAGLLPELYLLPDICVGRTHEPVFHAAADRLAAILARAMRGRPLKGETTTTTSYP